MTAFGPRTVNGVYLDGTQGAARILKGRVTSVDSVRWTVSVRTEDGRSFPDLPMVPRTSNPDGSGSASLPQENSLVTLAFTGSETTPIILGGAVAPLGGAGEDAEQDPTDYRMNRPVLNPGDDIVASSATGFIIMRKGGMLEVGSGDNCQRIYVPVQDIIREFCRSTEQETDGSTFKQTARVDDPAWGANKTPFESVYQVYEFCEDENPIVDLRIGRIKDEDDESIVNSPVGTVVYRLIINDQYRLWIDKQGNYQEVRFGKSFETYAGPRVVHHDASLQEVVSGTHTERITTRASQVTTTDSLEVGRDRTVTVGGNYLEAIRGSVKRLAGDLREELGDVSRLVKGSIKTQVLNNVEEQVLGSRSTATALAANETIGGSKQTVIANATGDSSGWKTLVAVGKTIIHNVLGKQEFSVGPTPQAATASIVQKISGAIKLEVLGGLVHVEVNGTGFRVKTPVATISVDSAGTTDLGPAANRGNVVTTTTHPVDYVTGAPILGTAQVRAGGPPAPGPAVLPSTFVSDPS